MSVSSSLTGRRQGSTGFISAACLARIWLFSVNLPEGQINLDAFQIPSPQSG
jgi:hypothetical protein